MSVVGHDEGGEGESGKGCREGRVGRWTRRGRSSREWEGVLRRACQSLDTTRADKEEGRATTRTKVRVVTPGEEVVEDLKDESGRQVRRFPTGRGAPTPKAPPHHKSGSRYRDRQPGFQTRARECSALGAAERLRGASEGPKSLRRRREPRRSTGPGTRYRAGRLVSKREHVSVPLWMPVSGMGCARCRLPP